MAAAPCSAPSVPLVARVSRTYLAAHSSDRVFTTTPTHCCEELESPTLGRQPPSIRCSLSTTAQQAVSRVCPVSVRRVRRLSINWDFLIETSSANPCSTPAAATGGRRVTSISVGAFHLDTGNRHLALEHPSCCGARGTCRRTHRWPRGTRRYQRGRSRACRSRGLLRWSYASRRAPNTPKWQLERGGAERGNRPAGSRSQDRRRRNFGLCRKPLGRAPSSVAEAHA